MKASGNLKRRKGAFFPGLLYLGLIGVLMSGRPCETAASQMMQPTPPFRAETVQPLQNLRADEALASQPLPVSQVIDVSIAQPQIINDALVRADDAGEGMRIESDVQKVDGDSSGMRVVEEALSVQPENENAAAAAMMTDIVFAEVGSQQALQEAALPPEVLEKIMLVEPAGCQRPIDDFNRIKVRDKVLNRRTYSMLQYAATIYNGKLDITDTGIIQGSYVNEGLEGGEIYRGGGVIDLAVSLYGSSNILYEEVEPLVNALRVAGFAAWFREEGEIYPGSLAHIHAVAIGDNRLSEAAAAQINGAAGYFNGYNGLISPDGSSIPDRYEGPVICQWMVDDGYIDSHVSRVVLAREPKNEDGWQERLKSAAARYETSTMRESIEIARNIDFAEGDIEHPANMCGPLAAAILRDADLLPEDMPPAYDMHNYWLANPRSGDRPFSLFPDWQYDKYRFSQSIAEFDFDAFPLLPADFIYTYAVSSGYDHMFVVTEVDDAGRVYTVTNQMQADHTYLIQRVLLYDPQDASVGALKNEWVNNGELGKTGLGGFALIRRKGFSLPAGNQFAYAVKAGDTILSVASRFNTRANDIIQKSNLSNVSLLSVGQSLTVPVNLDSNSTPALVDIPRTASDVLAYSGGRQSGPHIRQDALPVARDGGQAVNLRSVAMKVRPDTSASPDERELHHAIDELYRHAPSGDWGIYIEDLNSGMVISAGNDIVYHPASTIKVAVGAAFMHWMDDHPDVKLSNGPVMNQRSYEQLLHAMLIKSEEEATTILINFLNRYEGYEVQTMLDRWGLENTTILPRRTMPEDMALLLKKLYRGELASQESTAYLLEILRTPSNNDDVRLGAGIPETLRTSLAHKPGTVFDDGWGVVSDVGVVSLGNASYVIVVLSNFVDWIDYDEAQTFIADISQTVFNFETGSGVRMLVSSQQNTEQENLSPAIARQLEAARPHKPDASGIRPPAAAQQAEAAVEGWSQCEPQSEGGAPQSCSVKVSFELHL